jgi:bacterioferritin-associated ferredoxin
MENRLICICKDVYSEDIEKAVREQNLRTVEEVGEVTGAGTVCGLCQSEVEAIIEDIIQLNGNE